MFLVVNNHGQYVHRIWRSLKYLGVEAEIIPNTVSLDELSSRAPEGVILSGGPYSVYEDAGKLGVCSELLSDASFPVLGICLGYQIIAEHFGGSVLKGETAEYAQVTCRILCEGDLFKGLPAEIPVWESHRDEVSRAPPGFTVLAESDICAVEALKHGELPIYGVQFHPEVEHTPHGMDILKNFIGVCSR